MSSASSSSGGTSHLDIGRVLSDAWRIARRSRPLWGLCAISTAQTAVYSLVVLLMVLPSAALPQLVAPLEMASRATAPEAAQHARASSVLLSGSEAIVRNLPAVIGGIIALLCVWIVSGVFDVAAQAGTITQVAEELGGRRASVGVGVRDGFAVWWQTIGLLAIAALPALVVVLGLGISTLLTYTLPLMRGELPSSTGAVWGQLALAPLQSIMSLVSVLLSVVVQLALRFVAIDRAPWRAALRKGWVIARRRTADVALVYLFATAVALAAVLAETIVLGLVCTLVGGLAGGLTLVVGAAFPVGLGVGIGSAVVVGSVGMFGFQTVLLAWYSAVWTILWSRVRGDAPEPAVGRVPVVGTDSVMGTAAQGQR